MKGFIDDEMEHQANIKQLNYAESATAIISGVWTGNITE